MENKDFKIQDSISGKKKSKLRKYMDMIVGSDSYWFLIKFELIVLFTSKIPGALGVVLRQV